MGGVTAQLASLPYVQDSWKLATTVSRDVVEGDALIRHASEVDAADLSSGPSDAVNFLGIAGEEYGGSASLSTTQPAGIDARPYAALWGRNIKTRIEDSATVAYGAELTLSGTTAGALVTATAGQPVVGICKRGITSGAVGQFTVCDILPAGVSTSSGGDIFMLQGTITDVSTAGSTFSASSPYAGDVILIYSTLSGTIATADAALSFELGGVAITGGGITITASGSAAGDVDTATPSALNSITAGQPIEMITDGASTNAESASLIFVVQR